MVLYSGPVPWLITFSNTDGIPVLCLALGSEPQGIVPNQEVFPHTLPPLSTTLLPHPQAPGLNLCFSPQ